VAQHLFSECLPEVRQVLRRALGSRLTAAQRDDCIQEALQKVWKHRACYRGNSEGEFLSWLRRIGDRACHDLYQRESRAPTTLSDVAEVGFRPALETVAAPTSLQRTELLTALRACCRCLNTELQRVVELLYEHQLSERSVARILNCSPANVHRLRRQAQHKLLHCLSARGFRPHE
jgi:RNA polymerase sigma factor (sigma-70 family)